MLFRISVSNLLIIASCLWANTKKNKGGGEKSNSSLCIYKLRRITRSIKRAKTNSFIKEEEKFRKKDANVCTRNKNKSGSWSFLASQRRYNPTSYETYSSYSWSRDAYPDHTICVYIKITTWQLCNSISILLLASCVAVPRTFISCDLIWLTNSLPFVILSSIVFFRTNACLQSGCIYMETKPSITRCS